MTPETHYLGPMVRLLLLISGATFLTLLGRVDASPPPGGWTFESACDEIAADHWFDSGASTDAPGLLGLAGRGDANVDGRWVKRVPVEAGKYYQFNSQYHATGVQTPLRSVLAEVVWFDRKNDPVERAEFPLTRPGDEGGESVLTGTYRPRRTTSARLELRLRWAPAGRVSFRPATLTETAAPGPRPCDSRR